MSLARRVTCVSVVFVNSAFWASGSVDALQVYTVVVDKKPSCTCELADSSSIANAR